MVLNHDLIISNLKKVNLKLALIGGSITIASIYYLSKKNNPLSKLPGYSKWEFWKTIKVTLGMVLRTDNEEAFDEYHHGDIYYASFFGEASVMVNSADLAKQVLNQPDLFLRESTSELSEGLLFDKALFTFPTDEVWKRHRKLMQPGFGPSHLRHTAHVCIKLLSEVDKHLEQELKKSDEYITNAQQFFTAIALDTLGIVAYGSSFNAIDAVFDPSKKPTKTILQKMTPIVLVRFFVPKFIWWIFGVSENGYFVRPIKKEIIDNVMVEREKDADLSITGGSEWKLNIKERLLRSQADGVLSDDEICSELVGLFLAGQETVTMTLMFLFYDLCRHPKVLETLLAEIENVQITDGSDYEILSSLTYLDAVFRETERLHSIVPAIRRINNEDTELQGYLIPKDSKVTVLMRSIHHNPKYYKNPMEYNPERWIHDEIIPGSFIPFGDGVHNCIAQKLAVIEMKIILFIMLKKYSISLPPKQNLHVSSQGLDPSVKFSFTKRK